MELGALQVVVVPGVAGEVLVVVVVVVVFVVLRLLDDIVSRTSSKQKAGMLITPHSLWETCARANKQTRWRDPRFGIRQASAAGRDVRY